MPVRSSNSSALKWPDRDAVDAAVRQWAAIQRVTHPELLQVGYFGSYARGDWGVGSDLDLIAIVEHSERPFAERALDWDTLDLPVPAELLVYTEHEWDGMQQETLLSIRFVDRLQRETVWL